MSDPSTRAAASQVRVLLLGATGLVGSETLRQLLAHDRVESVVAVVRRELALMDPKLTVRVADFDKLGVAAPAFAVDAIICALGTTIKQAGSQERFRRVDHDYPLAAARMGLERGARHFLLVSAIGADATSRIFYNRVKGEVEQGLLALGYPRVTIVRPSLLLGPRSERRFGEEVAKVFGWALPKKYRPVHARDVAATLVREAVSGGGGSRVIESREMLQAFKGSDPLKSRGQTP